MLVIGIGNTFVYLREEVLVNCHQGWQSCRPTFFWRVRGVILGLYSRWTRGGPTRHLGRAGRGVSARAAHYFFKKFKSIFLIFFGWAESGQPANPLAGRAGCILDPVLKKRVGAGQPAFNRSARFAIPDRH